MLKIGSLGKRAGAITSSAILLCAVACGDAQQADSPFASDPQFQRDKAIFEQAVGTTHGLDDEKVRDMFNILKDAPFFKNKFLGISTLQNPSDAWILMEIIHEVKPDLIVEAGTYHGGSAVLWAIILEHINPAGEVITIDIEDQREPSAVSIPIAQERVTFLLGSSTAPDVIAEVYRRAEGKRVLVMLDSLHSKEHVAAELAAYAPLIPVGGYIVVQDTMFGPIAAIEAFLAANSNFVADRERERYPDTLSIKGYIRRLR